MDYLMFQFRERHGKPTLESACRMFDLQPEDIDAEFGLIQTDSQEGLYTLLVTEGAAARLQEHPLVKSNESDPSYGVFANPRVETTNDEKFDPSF